MGKFFLTLTLVMSAAAAAEQGQNGPQAECDSTFEQRQARLAQIWRNTESRESGPSKEQEACANLAQSRINSCALLARLASECRPAALETAGSGGIAQAANAQIRSTLRGANCQRTLGLCYSNSSEFGASCMTRENEHLTRAMEETRRLLAELRRCHDQSGQDLEQEANRLWGESGNGKSAGQTSRERLFCVNTDNDIRICRFSDDGSQSFNEISAEDRDLALAGTGPADLQNCSGGLLGDGITVVTAGHCINSQPSEDTRFMERDITVYDRDGLAHIASARCRGRFVSPLELDAGVCTLSQPLTANPVYYATHDPSVRGPDCETEGYIMRCGTQYFNNLSGRPARILGYPGGYSLSEATGLLTYDPVANSMTHNIPSSGGNSGSGVYVTDGSGRIVIVGAHSWTNRMLMGEVGQAGFPILSSTAYYGLRVQSLSLRKVENAQNFFTRIMDQ